MLTIFKYHFLCFIRSKDLMFWTLVFPIIMTTLFGLVLINVYKTDSFKTVPVAIIETDALQADTNFQSTLDAMNKDATPLFKVTYTSKEEANMLLETGEVDGIIEKQESFHVQVVSSGMNQTIIQSFMNEYIQKQSMITKLITHGIAPEKIMESFTSTTSYIQSETQNNMDVSSIYFYTLIAMCCLYGGYLSLVSMQNTQANLSSVAMRNSLAPIHKFKILIIDFCITYTTTLVTILIIIAYMKIVFHIDFGNDFYAVLCTIAAGSLTGNSFGTFIGVVSNKDIEVKTAMLTSFTMALSFLAGMMVLDIKYIIQLHAPWLAAINPANMITDALYAIYYYGPQERYIINIMSLVLFSTILYGASYIILRRKQYASL